MTLKLTNQQILSHRYEKHAHRQKLSYVKARAKVSFFRDACETKFKAGATYLCRDIQAVIRVGKMIEGSCGRYFDIVQHPDLDLMIAEDKLTYREREETPWRKRVDYFEREYDKHNDFIGYKPRDKLPVMYDDYFTDRFEGYEELKEGTTT
jgi:hypothetical protein